MDHLHQCSCAPGPFVRERLVPSPWIHRPVSCHFPQDDATVSPSTFLMRWFVSSRISACASPYRNLYSKYACCSAQPSSTIYIWNDLKTGSGLGTVCIRQGVVYTAVRSLTHCMAWTQREKHTVEVLLATAAGAQRVRPHYESESEKVAKMRSCVKWGLQFRYRRLV